MTLIIKYYYIHKDDIYPGWMLKYEQYQREQQRLEGNLCYKYIIINHKQLYLCIRFIYLIYILI